jgi:signal transduction histidine kinase
MIIITYALVAFLLLFISGLSVYYKRFSVQNNLFLGMGLFGSAFFISLSLLIVKNTLILHQLTELFGFLGSYFLLVFSINFPKTRMKSLISYFLIALPYLLFSAVIFTTEGIHLVNIDGNIQIIRNAILTGFYLISDPIALISLGLNYIKSDTINREKLRPFLISIGFYLTVTTLFDSLLPLIGITFPLELVYLVIIAPLFTASYSIFKFNFLEFDPKISKFVAQLIFLTCVLISYFASLLLLSSMTQVTNPLLISFSASYIVLLSVLYPKINIVFEKTTTNFSNTQYLNDFTENILKCHELKGIKLFISLFFKGYFHVDQAKLFCLSGYGTNKQTLLDYNDESGETLLFKNYLGYLFKIKNRSHIIIKSTQLELPAKLYKYNIILPIVENDIVIAILCLKRDPDTYTKDDLDQLIHITKIIKRSLQKAKPVELFKSNYKDTLGLAQEMSMKVTYANLTQAIAHEIKNPLGMLQVGARRLQQHADNKEYRDKFVDLIQRNVDRALYICKLMLEYNSVHAIQKKDIVDINTIIQDAVSLTKLKVSPDKIKLVQSTDSIPIIKADKSRLYEVILNLLINAVEAISEKGFITVTSALNTNKTNEKSILINVTDTGCGIPTPQLKTIFSPLYNTKEGNNGLGLSISRDIIKNHGGSIRVDSLEGRGSSFSVYLPVE